MVTKFKPTVWNEKALQIVSQWLNTLRTRHLSVETDADDSTYNNNTFS